jgi:hypothetical protein
VREKTAIRDRPFLRSADKWGDETDEQTKRRIKSDWYAEVGVSVVANFAVVPTSVFALGRFVATVISTKNVRVHASTASRRSICGIHYGASAGQKVLKSFMIFLFFVFSKFYRYW